MQIVYKFLYVIFSPWFLIEKKEPISQQPRIHVKYRRLINQLEQLNLLNYNENIQQYELDVSKAIKKLEAQKENIYGFAKTERSRSRIRAAFHREFDLIDQKIEFYRNVFKDLL